MSLPRILPLLAVLFFAVACGRGDRLVTGTEQEDSDFMQAQELKKRGLETEALAAYTRVITRRGELAPESYLDAGLIYFQKIKDPFKGWIYMQQYLMLQPNSPRREEVRQQVIAAEREAILQRLAQSQFAGGELQQLQDQVDQLTKENARLEAELKMIREAPSGVMTRSEILLTPTTTPAGQILLGPAMGRGSSSGPINLNPIVSQSQVPIVIAPLGASKSNPPAESKGAVSSQKGAPAPAQKGSPASTKAAPAAGRTHPVRSGDTLNSISRQYYNGDISAARINALRQANRDVLKDGDKLSLGTTLKIP